MTVKIDKGIKPPDDTCRGQAKYPWWDMEVGDSFLFLAKRAAVQGPAIPIELKQKGWRFTTRREGEGRRVWRIA